MAKKRTTKTKSKPSSLAEARRNRRPRPPRENPSPRANPPIMKAVTEALLPGAASYAATRAIARIIYAVVAKRWPAAARHIHAATGIATCAAAGLLAPRWDKLAPYQDPILVGSGIAAIQGISSAYLPLKYRWLISDPQASEYRILPVPEGNGMKASAAAASPGGAGAAAGRRRRRRRGNSDEMNISDEALDRLVDEANSRRASAGAAPSQEAGVSDDEEMHLDPDVQAQLDEEDCEDEELYTGAFARDN